MLGMVAYFRASAQCYVAPLLKRVYLPLDQILQLVNIARWHPDPLGNCKLTGDISISDLTNCRCGIDVLFALSTFLSRVAAAVNAHDELLPPCGLTRLGRSTSFRITWR